MGKRKAYPSNMANPKSHTPQEQAQMSRKAAVSVCGSSVKRIPRLAAATRSVDGLELNFSTLFQT